MVNTDQAQGGQQTGGGQRTYSEEDVMTLMNEAARRAATEAVKRMPREEDGDDTAVSVINPKVVKQLKDTVAVFTALKELSSNPLQKTIEETVGGMAASVVQSAFAPRGPSPKQDIVDKMLNSQFAYGLGSGLGQRAPELVETMGRTFGTDKTGQMMDSIIGKYGGQGGQSRQLSPGPSSPSGSSSSAPSSPSSIPEQSTDKQSEKELLLSLDPNNPEHVSAYAETQGGLPVDVARKMLMIHQDAFIEQLKRDGTNVDQISTQRGSRAQSSPPVQQPPPPAQSVSPPSTRQDTPPTPPTYPGGYPDNPIEQPSSQSIDNIEYAEYHDVSQSGQASGPQLRQPGHQPAPPSGPDNQQTTEMMKTFANDIGKVMGEMLNKIESLNNTVFTLQTEMNDMKIQGSKRPHTEMPPRVPSRTAEYPPGTTPPVIPTSVDTPSLETFEDQIIGTPKEELYIERSEDFFEENIIDVSNFKQELEEEAKLEAEKLKPVIQPIPPPVAQPTPPVQSVPIPKAQPPIVQIPPPVTRVTTVQAQPPIIQHVGPPIEHVEPSQKSTVQHVEPPLLKPISIKESITDVPKTEPSESNSVPITHDNKTSEDKNDVKFVIPIKKVGIHKKAAHRNLKPSFKKSDDKENKEENNIDREV